MSIKNFRERSPVLIGILSILGIAAGTTFAFFIDRLPFIKQAYNIQAEFSDAAGLNVENQVRVAGVKVGTVESVELSGDRVMVRLEIQNDTQIPDDAGAEIKLATILGTKFVEIEGAGGGPYMEDGDLIPLERTTIPYEIYQASNEGVAVLEGLDGDALNRMLSTLADVTELAQEEIGHALEGLNELGANLNAKERDLLSLLKSSRDLTALLSDEGDEIIRLIDASNDVLGSLAQQREELQSLLESTKFMAAELTSLIRANRGNIDSILSDLERALAVLDRNIEHIDMALEYAGPSTRYFGRVFSQGRWGDIYSCAIILTGSCEQDE